MEAELRHDRDSVERHRLAVAVLAADELTPVQAAARLRAAGRRVALLESAGGPLAQARHSFVCFDFDATLTSDGRRTRIQSEGHEALRAEPLAEVIRDFARRRRLPPPPPGLPPFLAGLVGYLAFEFAAHLEPSYVPPEIDSLAAPLAVIEAPRSVLAFDHLTQRCFLAVRCERGAAGFAAANECIDSTLHALAAGATAPLSGAFACSRLAPTRPAGDFLAAVDRARHAIVAGDVFQVVLARAFAARFEGDPFALYRALRIANGAPHMFFFESQDVTLVGSSPERLVDVRSRRVTSVPIAGTRRRGRDDAENLALQAELFASVKERSEHDMLVDLARNDLGRIARIGSVAVAEHARLVELPRVMHLVSRVEADLAAGRDFLDVIAATFPAGTVSGAPKVRALQLIGELEGERRGPYGGAFGWIDPAGDLDLALVIRSFVAQDSRLVLQAGAGVVHASLPEHELAEIEGKLAGPRDALERATAVFGRSLCASEVAS
jgi:anthranilate synthase component 1